MVKDLITVQLTNKFGYFCDLQVFKIITRIMTDNIMSGHIHILRISYNFQNTYSNTI